jgi:hypothetical protein
MHFFACKWLGSVNVRLLWHYHTILPSSASAASYAFSAPPRFCSIVFNRFPPSHASIDLPSQTALDFAVPASAAAAAAAAAAALYYRFQVPKKFRLSFI